MGDCAPAIFPNNPGSPAVKFAQMGVEVATKDNILTRDAVSQLQGTKRFGQVIKHCVISSKMTAVNRWDINSANYRVAEADDTNRRGHIVARGFHGQHCA